MLLDHGGNLRKIAEIYQVPEKRLIDFSSNINPIGINPKIRAALARCVSGISRYPDPESKSAKEALASYLEVDKENILLGNGSNEFIHLIPHLLKCQSGLICQPTFSEYELSLKASGIKPYFLFAREEDGFSIDIKKIYKFTAKVRIIILCNPNNPTGFLIKKNELLELTKLCAKKKTYLLIDEAFMEFVDKERDISLLKEAIKNKGLLVLRSLTKFFSLPGLRIGYLVANKVLIKKLSLSLPTWSVNTIAQGIITPRLFDQDFINKTKEYVKRERHFLFHSLKSLEALYPYNPTANFIFCKILNKKINTKILCQHLIKYGIVIRDCSNFKGLDNHFFRLAVRKRRDNLELVESLKKILL